MRSISDTPVVNLQIVYRPPPRRDVLGSFALHKRQLKGIPEPTARRMLRDFATYQARRNAAEQHKAYTYQQGHGDGNAEDTAMVALDFGEIVCLESL